MRRLRTVTEALLCCSFVFAARLAAQDVAEFESLIKSGKMDDAKAAITPYVASHPESWQAQYQLGYVDFRLHRMQDSVSMLCKSIVLNPNFADSHKILAYALNVLGHQELAVRELDRAIALDPRSAESHYELGRIYYEQGSYPKAIEQLETAKSLSPEYVRAYHNLGLAYSAIGENVKAVDNFEAGLRLNIQQRKPSAWPLIDYATYFNVRNEFEKARELLVRAVAIDGSADQAFSELGKAYRGLGETAQAIESLKRAVALNPSKPEYHYTLSQLFAQSNEPALAKQQLAEYEREKLGERK